MLGAIIGDIVGSVYEFESYKSKQFPLFSAGCRPTDDSLMTLAVGAACLSHCEEEDAFKQVLVRQMRRIGRQNPDAGYGGSFYDWLMGNNPAPYGSYGNGSAMRVSPVAYAAQTLKEVEKLAKWSAEVTHNHPEGIKGAQAVAAAVFLARQGEGKAAIRRYVQEKYYDLDFRLDDIRPTYRFDVTCQGSVPQAIVCFLEGLDYEDTLRCAVSLGGDGDTLAAMAGGIAEAHFGIPEEIQEQAFSYMDDDFTDDYTEYIAPLYE